MTKRQTRKRMLTEVHTRPKSKALFDAIRADILEGHFAPGHWLKLAELENRYSAGRSEVRSALSSLAERGIVEYSENRGFRVFQRSPEEVRDITEMIVVLETAAAPSILERASSRDIAELEELARNFEEISMRGRHAELRLANYRFHERLNSLAANTFLASTVRNLRECCITGPFTRYANFQGLMESSREHHAIVEALRAKDLSQFVRLLREHGSHVD